VTGGTDAFEEQARSLTSRLLRASEQDPRRPFEPAKTSVPRAVAVVLATAIVVAGLIFVGKSVLHIQFSQHPTVTPPVTATLPVATPPAVTPTPSIAPSPTASPADSVTNLHMFTSTTGWAQRQSDGAILRTTQGVQRWRLTSPSIATQTVIAAAFIDSETARILTTTASLGVDEGAIALHSWATNNGGASWSEGGGFSAFASAGEPPDSLDFVDPDHGWFSVTGLAAAGSSAIYIYRTVDGGQEWAEVEATVFMPTGANGDISIGCDKNPASFINPSTGWVTAQCNGGEAFLSVTNDGGLTWRTQSLGVSRSQASIFGYTTDPPQFVSGSVGFMPGFAGGPPAARATMFVTTNGGASWSARESPDYDPDAFEFINADDGWLLISGSITAATSETNLWVTDNAGRTWTNLHTNANLVGFSLDFVSAQLGWADTALPAPNPPAVGLMQTTDGGRTWSPVATTIAGS
jgi:photosystem II stability/assembly factor-like uncharacterized protein